MIKLIQISDLHLTNPGELVFDRDPLAQLDACLADVTAKHADADMVVISGDLTNDCEEPAYRALAERMAGFALPYRLMLGNHDHRALFRTIFPGTPAEGGYVQSVVDLDGARLVLLDTLDQGRSDGHLCADRLAWLDQALAAAPETPAFLFMHHPPLDIHVPALDDSKLMDHADLADVIARHGNVRHIFAGHVHRATSGTWRGIAFATAPSTNHQSAATFGEHRYAVSDEPPGYNVIFIEPESVVVQAMPIGG